MSKTPPRSVAEIQTEYQQLCCKAGHLQYQVSELKKELALVNDTLQTLNLEAFNSKAAETTTAYAAIPAQEIPAPTKE